DRGERRARGARPGRRALAGVAPVDGAWPDRRTAAMTVTPDPPRDADHHGSPGPGEEPTAGHQPSSLGATELEKAAAAPSSAGTTTQPATPSHAFAAAPVDVGSSTPSGVTTGPTPAPYHQRPAPPRVPDHPQAPPTAHALDEPRSG